MVLVWLDTLLLVSIVFILLILCELLLYFINSTARSPVDYSTIFSLLLGRLFQNDWWEVEIRHVEKNEEAYIGPSKHEARVAYMLHQPYTLVRKNGRLYHGFETSVFKKRLWRRLR